MKLTINETSTVLNAAFSHDGRMLATGNYRGLVRIWDASNGWLIHEFQEFPVFACRIRFSPDDRSVVSANGEGTIHIRTLAESRPPQVLTGHTGQINSLLFSADGAQLASTAEDSAIRIWEVSSGRELKRIIAEPAKSSQRRVVGSWINDRLWVHDQGADGGLRSFGSDSGLELRSIKRPELSRARCVVQVSWDGRLAASAGRDGIVRVFDTDSSNWLTWVSYSRDGRQLVTSERYGTLRVWDRNAGTAIRSAQIGQSPAWTPAISTDGRTLVAGVDHSLVWLEYPSLQPLRRDLRSPVHDMVVALSPDSRLIASCGHQSPYVHLSSTDGDSLGRLEHAANVLCLAFSPDGRTLATGDMNHEVHLWDVQRQAERATFPGHDAWVSMVQFSPDGKTLASSSDDGTIRLWRSEPPLK